MRISTEVKTITEGKIVKLVRHRGFGFINVESEEEDVFFHHSGLENAYFEDLSVGDELEFEINDTDKGPEAVSISKVVGTELEAGELTEEPVSDAPASEVTLDEHLGW